MGWGAARTVALTYDVIETLSSVTSPGRSHISLPGQFSGGRVRAESSLSLATHSVNLSHSSSLPSPLSEAASDRLLRQSLYKDPHSFRLSPGDRGRGGWIPGGTHPRGSTFTSDWLYWVPVATASAADWSSGRRSARRRLRPRWVFVVGLRSRRSRRKRQDNGDPGRRVRLPIQRCGQWGKDERRRGGKAVGGRTKAALQDPGPRLNPGA